MDSSYLNRFAEDTFQEKNTQWGGVDISIEDGYISIYFNNESVRNESFKPGETRPWFYEGSITVPFGEDNIEQIMERIKSVIEVALAHAEKDNLLGLEVQHRVAVFLRQQGLDVDSSDIDHWMVGILEA